MIPEGRPIMKIEKRTYVVDIYGTTEKREIAIPTTKEEKSVLECLKYGAIDNGCCISVDSILMAKNPFYSNKKVVKCVKHVYPDLFESIKNQDWDAYTCIPSNLDVLAGLAASKGEIRYAKWRRRHGLKLDKRYGVY